MRVPLSWLRDYVDVSATAAEIAERLIFSGTEVEAIEPLGVPDVGDNRDHYRLGRVIEFTRHPNADRLRLCRVDVGESEPRQIICGASNFVVGDTVAVVLPGGRLPGTGEKLKRAKLRGEVSDGMMLSERELQISDVHAGIITLSDDAGSPGTPLDELFALTETILVLALTSNRGDCQSIHGVAREVATVFDTELRPLPASLPEAGGTGHVSDVISVDIEAPERCRRFTARVLRDVVIGVAPLRMRQRLAAAGMRPISNVVDITNYVMLASGQPLHAYDARRIRGARLVARMAHPDERLTTLDGRERPLDDSMLVIADAEGPNGLAGIMGGGLSEIADDTSTLVLEAASFERTGILETSQRLGLRSEASARFEKGVDPEIADSASAWASDLLVEHAGARLVPGFVDVRRGTWDRQRLTLRPGRVEAVLGMPVEESESVRILDGLGFEPRKVEAGVEVLVPGHRRADVTREIDLVEEVGRIVGFHTIPSRMPRLVGRGWLTPTQRLTRRTADVLTGLGLQEAVTTTFAPAGAADRYGLSVDDPRRIVVRPRNPLSAEYADLRTTIVPHLLDVLAANQARGRRDLSVFEIARTYHPVADRTLPAEPTTLAFCLSGRLGGSGWLGAGPPADIFLARGVLDQLGIRMGLTFTYEGLPARSVPYLHPGRAVRVLVGGEAVGELGELHPRVARRFELDLGRIGVCELDLDRALESVRPLTTAARIPDQPPVRQDIAIVLPQSVLAADVVTEAIDAGAPLLADVQVFDVYRDDARLGPERVSLALRLTFQDPDRTLTEDEASIVRGVVVDRLGERFGAELRS